ncbi:MAG: LytTR family transcriptional regulator [Bacteroidota bacterium]|nr:LytTR family transcriptional regulator [Bacteroidota bacterium]
MNKSYQILPEQSFLPGSTVDAKWIQEELHLLHERLTQMSRQIEIDPDHSFISLYNRGVQCHIRIADILMIRSESNYSKFYLTSGSKILSCRTLKYWASEIHHRAIRRTHASYLINTHYILQVDKRNNVILLHNGMTAKLSRRHKASF